MLSDTKSPDFNFWSRDEPRKNDPLFRTNAISILGYRRNFGDGFVKSWDPILKQFNNLLQSPEVLAPPSDARGGAYKLPQMIHTLFLSILGWDDRKCPRLLVGLHAVKETEVNRKAIQSLTPPASSPITGNDNPGWVLLSTLTCHHRTNGKSI